MADIHTSWSSEGFFPRAVYDEDTSTSDINPVRASATYFRGDFAFTTPIPPNPVLDPQNAEIMALFIAADEGEKVISVDQFNAAIFPGKAGDAEFRSGSVPTPLYIRFSSFGRIDNDATLRNYTVPYATFPVHICRGKTQYSYIAQAPGKTAPGAPNFSTALALGQTVVDGEVIWQNVGNWSQGDYEREIPYRNEPYSNQFPTNRTSIATDGIAYDYAVQTAGTTGPTEPVWTPELNSIVIDGTVQFKNIGPWNGVTYGDSDLNGRIVTIPHDIVPSVGDDGWSVVIDEVTDNAFALWRSVFERVGGFPAGIIEGGLVTVDETFPYPDGPIGAPWINESFGVQSFNAVSGRGKFSVTENQAIGFTNQALYNRPVGEGPFSSGTTGLSIAWDMQLAENPLATAVIQFTSTDHPETQVGVNFNDKVVSDFQTFQGDFGNQRFNAREPFLQITNWRHRLLLQGTVMKYRNWDPALPEPTEWLFVNEVIDPVFSSIKNIEFKIAAKNIGSAEVFIDNVVITTGVTESEGELGTLVKVTCSWGGVDPLSLDGRSTNWRPEPWRTAKSSRSSGSGLNIIQGEVLFTDLVAAIEADERGDIDKAIINHALHYSTRIPRGPSNDITKCKFPATTTDGFINEPTLAIQQGSRLWLDCTDAEIAALTKPYERVYARTARKFGVYCSDQGGAIIATTTEFPWSKEHKAVQKKYGLYGYIKLNWPWAKLKLLKNWDGSDTVTPVT